MRSKALGQQRPTSKIQDISRPLALTLFGLGLLFSISLASVIANGQTGAPAAPPAAGDPAPPPTGASPVPTLPANPSAAASPIPDASARSAGQPAASGNASGPAPGVAAPDASGAKLGDSGMLVPETIFAGVMDPFEYDPRGRKDPFVQPIPEKPLTQGALHGPILPLQAFNLEQLRLVGIIWDVRHPKAMIKDPEGKTHIVGPNTKVGPKNGYIAVIREGEMVVVETTEQMGKLVSTAQVVKIAK